MSKNGDFVAPLSAKVSIDTVNGKNVDDIDLSEKALNPVSSTTANIDASGVEVKTIPLPASKGVRLRANMQLVALCFSMFLLGWNDGPTGPLLPRFQSFYHVCICLTRHRFFSDDVLDTGQLYSRRPDLHLQLCRG